MRLRSSLQEINFCCVEFFVCIRKYAPETSSSIFFLLSFVKALGSDCSISLAKSSEVVVLVDILDMLDELPLLMIPSTVTALILSSSDCDEEKEAGRVAPGKRDQEQFS